MIYCKGGGVRVGRRVNIGANCVIYSKNHVAIGSGTIIAAFAHIMSGGQYDYTSDVLFADQSSMSQGPTIIGNNCWIGSKVVVQDNVEIGSGSVIGSGAVVTNSIPTNVVAVGVPARVTAPVKKIK
ncbi:MAG: acyltransferase [Desulfobacterales bacterium]|nr:acyltransferase [Desulfobacterales bacterium]